MRNKSHFLRMYNFLYFYTLPDETLYKMYLITKETTSLGLNNIYSLTLSLDGKQILVIQSDSAKFTLALYDIDGVHPVKSSSSPNPFQQ